MAEILYFILSTFHLLFLPQVIFLTSSIFKRNFELTSKQPVNTISNKPTSFNSNLLPSALTNFKTFRKKALSFQIQISYFKERFQLSLPLKWKAIHQVFHVSLLEPAKGLYPGKTHPISEPFNIQDHLEWEVSRILDSRLRKGKLQYLVEWTGYQSEKDQTSWETTNHLGNFSELICDVHST
ncbi:uncharacterized protein VP01_2512g3 [Puccinia sorghi]|uniref:Chromo domain-containing protein n=1 Tax=Puccinia sorghi TaxID=27349 RepID=A0A0L6V5L0_9BASI|nr:uncharacterized protein VP01_2512g3 [Puccinia sorghi]